ncbi:putative polyprenol reductase-like [Tropilaelaps mercedesae]|uniref:Polyprenal reductase n=1 Tax=Tropilaelaps mercedesae TaxID=418985 RepID=A0A1V9XJK0_9ACAR|nr:putative polyprenol reductase-like [Tropilaelaps mercedesae]
MTFSSSSGGLQQLSLSFSDLLRLHVVLGTAMWTAAFWLEHDVAKRFANLRKDRTGKVVSTKHTVPSGGMFELVSSPHYFAEIMIYTSLTVVLGCFNLTWFFAVLWTYVNQIAIALLTHQWYQTKFKEYPASRRAVIPFLL